jgi:energy-coupling factor transport system substrate-specific component
MKILISMWKYPRMIAWFLAAIVLYLLARWPFMKASIIPFYLEFRPAIVIVPLVGVFWGPAGALGAMVGSLAGDALFGYWDALSLFRAAGHLLFAYSAKMLWDFSLSSSFPGPDLTPRWGRTFRFLLVCWPGCFLAAAWPAWGADILQVYPFTYICSLLLMNNLIFCTLLGLALYRIVARELVPWFGTWHSVMEKEIVSRLSLAGAACQVTGCIGAVAAGLLASGLIYRMWPTGPFIHGTSSGPLLTVLVLPFLLLQIASLFMTQRTPASSPASPEVAPL